MKQFMNSENSNKRTAFRHGGEEGGVNVPALAAAPGPDE